MKTTKAKTTSKPKKTTVTAKTGISRKATTSKSGPTEEEIRAKAKEIFQERMGRGENGTSVDDWLKAEALLKGSKK
jgi:hypothetical protein